MSIKCHATSTNLLTWQSHLRGERRGSIMEWERSVIRHSYRVPSLSNCAMTLPTETGLIQYNKSTNSSWSKQRHTSSAWPGRSCFNLCVRISQTWIGHRMHQHETEICPPFTVLTDNQAWQAFGDTLLFPCKEFSVIRRYTAAQGMPTESMGSNGCQLQLMFKSDVIVSHYGTSKMRPRNASYQLVENTIRTHVNEKLVSNRRWKVKLKQKNIYRYL
jgi:hypothetical protein